MVIFHSYVSLPEGNWKPYLVGGAITILKNDGVRQWEGLHLIYEMENETCSKPPTRYTTANKRLPLVLDG